MAAKPAPTVHWVRILLGDTRGHNSTRVVEARWTACGGIGESTRWVSPNIRCVTCEACQAAYVLEQLQDVGRTV